MLRSVTVQAAVYTVNSGVVGLSAEQAKTRLQNLKPVKGKVDDRKDSKTFGAGEYEVMRPIQFKSGEKFGYSGMLAKNGELHDPEAEELQRMERAESTEQAVKVAVAAERERCRQEYNAALQKATEGLRAQLEPELRKELEARIRDELAGEQKK